MLYLSGKQDTENRADTLLGLGTTEYVSDLAFNRGQVPLPARLWQNYDNAGACIY
jgi:hypothetical protein